MPTVYTANSKSAAITKAILGACQPCCGGSGSGGGRRTPNGCAGCPCCECSCWWATGWHKTLTKENLLRGPLLVPDWTLTSNTITQVGGDPDEMFLGDVASDLSQCTIGGLATIDGNGDIIGNVDDPAYPRWEGDLIYTDGMVTTTLHVIIKLQFTLSWTCDGVTVPDSFTWSGTTVTVTDGPGIDLNTEVPDYYPIVDGNYGLDGTLTNCSGTIVLEGVSSGIVLPDLTLEMISDPNCSGSGSGSGS